MELFEKIYGCYYQAVGQILKEAAQHPITQERMREIIAERGYQESALILLPKLCSGDWALLEDCGNQTYRSLLKHPPQTPLTNLQKSWLKALLLDDKIPLFLTPKEQKDFLEEWSDVPPLYDPEDFYLFDQFADGDVYSSRAYQKHFSLLLEAMETGRMLSGEYFRKNKRPLSMELAPCQLQYSAKNNRFRLLCLQIRSGAAHRPTIWNLDRILTLRLLPKPAPDTVSSYRFSSAEKKTEPVVIAINGQRNSLERCMLHFANYEKHTQYDPDSGVWKCSIYYDDSDEPELLIELLSFGPVLKVLEPASFAEKIRKRVVRQQELFSQPLVE